MTTKGTTSDKEWYKNEQRVAMNNNEWQRVVISANFYFFSNKHPKENFLNLKEDPEERLELRAKKTPLRRNISCKKQELRQFFCL